MSEKDMEIKCFNYGENAVRTVERDGEVWFVAKDICDILELTNPTEAIKSLDDDEKMTLRISDGHSGQRGGAQFLNIISESGLYRLTFRSNKPEAKKFTKWVTSEVLPSIRRTGSYSVHGENESVYDKFTFEGWDIVRSALNAKTPGELEKVRKIDKAFENYTGESPLKKAGIDVESDRFRLYKQHKLSLWKQRIIDYLKEHGTATPFEIHKELGLHLSTAHCNLRRLRKEGLIIQVGYGLYGLDE